MAKDEYYSDVSINHQTKPGSRTCRKMFIVFILVFCSGCLLSILMHSLLSQSDFQNDLIAEICIGEIFYEGDPAPIMRQGVWISTPFLPYFRGIPMSSFRTNKIICGIIPWAPGLTHFAMLEIRPFGIYYDY